MNNFKQIATFIVSKDNANAFSLMKDINIKDDDNNNLLIIAILSNNYEIATFLVENKIEINVNYFINLIKTEYSDDVYYKILYLQLIINNYDNIQSIDNLVIELKEIKNVRQTNPTEEFKKIYDFQDKLFIEKNMLELY